jgi:hypothetical protein
MDVMRWLPIVLALVFGIPGLAQDGSPVSISPAKVTMLVGETRTFRAVDKNGHMLHDVRWSTSQPGMVELRAGDEVQVTSAQPGKCSLTARSSQGSGDAEVEVLAGSKMPAGTILWSGPQQPGCKPTNITQAVPTADGPDLYEDSTCPDGRYISAFTADGILLWRRNLDSKQKPSASLGGGPTEGSVVRLNTHATSICDSVSAGMTKDAIADLLKAGHLPPTADFSQNLWLVEEEHVQCKIWFDAESRVTKKRKVLTAE